MPAALMWAPGLDQRPATVHFDPPSGMKWQVATQLLPGPDSYTFSAPNLQYLMDSPAEFSAFSTRTFSVADGVRTPMFRIAMHHTGSDADLDAFAKDVETIVREARGVYGEFPAYEGNRYTFVADYLPWSNGDGMEHRNSTILTSRSSIRNDRLDLLDGISHEFFHSWNVERIRPRSLEPFNLDDVNVSGELWLAEGFTNYYGPLILHRAGLLQLNDYLRGVADTINTVTASPGRRIRSAEDMSRLAPFVDAAVSIDRTNFNNVYLSYYTWGEAIGLGLDLVLRDRSNGVVTLDEVMRALWQQYGKPGGSRAGYVDRPYTMGDVVATLASVSGDAAFAEDFVARYVRGHEVVDYARLLGRAGLILRPRSPGRPFVGELRLEDEGGQVRITAPVPMGSPAYEAGLERDDVITGFIDVGTLGGMAVRSTAEFERAIAARHPGDAVQVTYMRRGKPATSAMRIVEDPRQELIPVENTGQPLSVAQKQFRDAWLKSVARNAF
jgi:predicted metalloprotease with PDZ domain